MLASAAVVLGKSLARDPGSQIPAGRAFASLQPLIPLGVGLESPPPLVNVLHDELL